MIIYNKTSVCDAVSKTLLASLLNPSTNNITIKMFPAREINATIYDKF